MRRIILYFLFVFLGTSAFAEITCDEPVFVGCESVSQEIEFDGITLEDFCASRNGLTTCYDDAPLNECQATEASSRCVEQSRECVAFVNGVCEQERLVFECTNEDGDMSPAILLSTRYGPIQETIVSHCDALEDDPVCVLDRTDITQGAEIRPINRNPVYRAWWQQERTYSCHVGTEMADNCEPLEADPTCRRIQAECLAYEGEFCTNYSYHYRCGIEPSDLEPSCTPTNVCAGSFCLGIDTEPDQNFGLAASWLHVLDEMVRDAREANGDINAVKFFVGQPNNCSSQPLRNCCSLSGLLAGVVPCGEREIALRDKRLAGVTHYVGSYCAKRVLGACINRKRVFCEFNTMFGRIFNEESREQLIQSWGTAKAPYCEGVTLAQLYALDLDAMDFSEAFGAALDAAEEPVEAAIINILTSRADAMSPPEGEFDTSTGEED